HPVRRRTLEAVPPRTACTAPPAFPCAPDAAAATTAARGYCRAGRPPAAVECLASLHVPAAPARCAGGLRGAGSLQPAGQTVCTRGPPIRRRAPALQHGTPAGLGCASLPGR